MRAYTLSLAFCLGSFAVAPLNAQANTPAEVIVHGTVVDTSGSPLSDVQVQRKGKRAVVTDASGKFSIPVEPKKTVQIELRRVGLHPGRFFAHTPPDTAVTLVMFHTPQVLPNVDVTARRLPNLERAGFYSRLEDREKGSNSGYFLTPEYLERRNGQRVTQLVENVPGVNVRVGMGGVDSPLLLGLNNCYMNIWIDGIPLTPDSARVFDQRNRLAATKAKGTVLGPAGQHPISSPHNVQLDEIIRGSSVAAIEVYPRGNQVPPKYQGLFNSSCGAVLIWLKGIGNR